MLATAIAHGFRTALSQWRLSVLLWFFGLLLPLGLVVPVAAWLASSTSRMPRMDPLAGGFDAGTFVDLVTNQGGAWTIVFGLTFAVLLLARIGQAFVLGGIVEVLRGEPNAPPPPAELALRSTAPRPAAAEAATTSTNGEPEARSERPARTFVMPVEPAPVHHRSTMHKFFKGAGRFFLRNLVMLVLTGVGVLVVANLLFLLVGFLVKPLESTTSEALAWLRMLLPLTFGALGAVFFLLAFDYACIRLVCERSHRPFASWFSALGFVGRHFAGTLMLWVLPGLLAGLALLVYFGLAHAVPTVTIGRILLVIVVQQLVVVARAVVRTATVAAELRYSSDRRFVSARHAGVEMGGLPA
jgi:hypothetical protein